MALLKKKDPAPKRGAAPAKGKQAKSSKRQGRLRFYFLSVAAKKKGLDLALREQGIKGSPEQFVRRTFFITIMLTVVVALAAGALLYVRFGPTYTILALVMGVAVYQIMFNLFLNYPIDKSKNAGKDVERDILFAARDLVISMRSGMPLFNALTAVSTGYGAASKEFARIVSLAELGEPVDQAIDEIIASSESRTFKRLMLQASVSIKAGADIIAALQDVIDTVTQERVIELRRYGQRLNALAMFYMLFGIIFPSMGIAVVTILSTFISIFTITTDTLIAAAVGIALLQVIFLTIMRSARPVFSV